MTDLNKQIEAIRGQKQIDPLPVEECRVVARHAIMRFRKYISPVNPAIGLEAKIQKILGLCRLADDHQMLAELLAARLAAQLAAAVNCAGLSDLAEASGLSVSSSSELSLGLEGSKACVLVNAPGSEMPDSTFKLAFNDWQIVVNGAGLKGDFSFTSFEEACLKIDEFNRRKQGGQKLIELAHEHNPGTNDNEIFDTVHDPWRPSTVYSDRLKVHPTQIIEPSTLAATPYPPAIYKPLLPAEAIDRGFISDAQFEVVTYGLQAITSDLPGSPLGKNGPPMKGGFIIGDGTGVGKTNEFCAIIMDQWLRGKKRHIVVVERSKHIKHVIGAWKMIGGEERHIMAQRDRGAKDALPARDGIMITSYALLRDPNRYKALVEWANAERVMDGVLVFDEAHNMRNAIEDTARENHSWGKNISQQGEAGLQIQIDLPRAGVIYASATIATDIYNLGFAIRLGLWGHNAPFESSSQFIAQMHKLDDAALEQICIDLKSAGRYTSRTLSFDGLEYEELVHTLTPAQRERFNETVKMGRTINEICAEAIRYAKGMHGKPKAYFTTKASSNQMLYRKMIESMLTDFNLASVIPDMHEMLAQGMAPVIQISMTGEAELTRRVGNRKIIPISDYRDKALENFIEREFPIVYISDDGTPRLDNTGREIPCPEALKLKQKALNLCHTIGAEMNPIDRIIQEFGVNNVAEMTGRSLRVIPQMEQGVQTAWRVEERTLADAEADVDAFQAGKKSILVFSIGAGGTGNDYHADRNCANQRRRVHYLVELGQRAENAVQGLGRTHRATQVVPPLVKMVTSDIPAHMIYASRTLSKISKMGALSRGHQHAASNAIFEQRIPMNSIYAAKAWDTVIDKVAAGGMPMTYDQLLTEMSLSGAEIRKFDFALRRLATITDGDQRALVNELISQTEANIASAINNGTFNSGLETITAESIELIDRIEIENNNGSKTVYYRLQEQHTIEKVSFRRAITIYAGNKNRRNTRAIFMRHKVSGKVALGVVSQGMVNQVDLTTPAGTVTRRQTAMQQEPWKIIDIDEAERLWEQQAANLDMRQTRDLHILSGSLLYNWDKLPQAGIGLQRCRTNDGDIIVGRVISTRDLRPTLAALGMHSTYTPPQIARLLSQVEKGGIIKIDNGWQVENGLKKGPYRLVIPDQEMHGMTIAAMRELGVNAINTPLGYEFEIERKEAIETIRRLAVGCTLSLSGITTNVANDTDPDVDGENSVKAITA